jgi:CheY-like chemotaxis protein
MPDGFAYRILVVDDEPSILTTSAAILSGKGYEVRTASGGFAALAELRRALPDLVISDLKMPHMSGFELLSVIRRRFPQIPVIAIRGEYNGIAPSGLIADAFLSKGSHTPAELFNKISELIEQSPIRPHVKAEKAPVWIPKNESGYFVVTCTECLRSFSLPDDHAKRTLHETECVFCGVNVRFHVDPQAIKAKR